MARNSVRILTFSLASAAMISLDATKKSNHIPAYAQDKLIKLLHIWHAQTTRNVGFQKGSTSSRNGLEYSVILLSQDSGRTITALTSSVLNRLRTMKRLN